MSEEVLSFLAEWSGAGLLVGSLFFSETLVIPASILSVQGVWLPIEIFIYVLIGTVIKDSIWFVGGRRAFSFVERWDRLHEGLDRFEKRSANVLKHPLRVLLFYKLVYGTRTATILYLARSSSVKLWQFVIFNAIGSAIWLIIAITIGRLAGMGIVNLIPALENVQMMLGAIVLGFITLATLRVIIRRARQRV